MSLTSKKIVLFDSLGNPIVTNDGSAPVGTAGLMVSGFDGVNSRRVLVDSAGRHLTKITDGTNFMPTGDAVSRSLFQKITDGTLGPVAVKVSAPAASADPALAVTISPASAAMPVTFSVAGSRSGVSAGVKILGGSTAGTLQVMRSTVYTEPASAAQRSLSSSSASDTAAGVGARTVKITYYDGAGAGPLTETVTLNGVGAVNTVAIDIRFIEKMEVVTSGSTGTNVGTITLFGSTGGGGGTVGTIGIGSVLVAVGDGQTLWAHHYVTTGYTAQLSVLVVGIESGGSGTNGKFFIKTMKPLVANSSEILVGDVLLSIGAFERAFTFNPNIVGFAKATAFAIPGGNNTSLTCAFDWSELPS
jgi:hypothetical protein